jgi:hypothetical protein
LLAGGRGGRDGCDGFETPGGPGYDMMNFLRPKGKRVVAGMRRQLSRTCEPSPATAMLLRPLTAVPGSRKAASVLRVSCDAMRDAWKSLV